MVRAVGLLAAALVKTSTHSSCLFTMPSALSPLETLDTVVWQQQPALNDDCCAAVALLLRCCYTATILVCPSGPPYICLEGHIQVRQVTADNMKDILLLILTHTYYPILQVNISESKEPVKQLNKKLNCI